MSSYVLTFRNPGVDPTAEQEDAWSAWFSRIGSQITDFGSRVGRTAMLGDPADAGDRLAGYIVIAADNLDAAVQIASGCPGLSSGGRVEVG
ncbi:MAG: YciI family protein, partial [Mycobacterium sp.]